MYVHFNYLKSSKVRKKVMTNLKFIFFAIDVLIYLFGSLSRDLS